MKRNTMKPVQATHWDPAYGPVPTWVHRVGKKPGTLVVGTKDGVAVREVPANTVKFEFGTDSKLFGIPYTDPYAVQERLLREVDEESIFTDASPGRVPVDPADMETIQADPTVQETRIRRAVRRALSEDFGKIWMDYGHYGSDTDGPPDHDVLTWSPLDDVEETGESLSPEYVSRKRTDESGKFPFTQSRLSESKIIRRFSQNVSDQELTWHRDRSSREVRVVEGKGWALQLDNQMPRPLLLGESYEIPAGQWHRLLRKEGATNLCVIIKELKKGDRVKHKGKKATVKVPDARGPLVGIDPDGPEDMEMVPDDEIKSVKEAKKKKGLWANVHAKRKRGEKPAKPGDKNYPDQKSLKSAQGKK